MWHGHDIQHPLKRRVFTVTVGSISLYGSEMSPLRVEDGCRLVVFDHQCPRNISRILWKYWDSKDEMRRHILDATSRPLTETTTQRQFPWFRNILRMPAPFRDG